MKHAQDEAGRQVDNAVAELARHPLSDATAPALNTNITRKQLKPEHLTRLLSHALVELAKHRKGNGNG